MKRILFVSTNDWVPWGGSEELWSRVAAELKKRGHVIIVSVADWSPVPPVLAQMEQEGILFKRRKNVSYSFAKRVFIKYGIKKKAADPIEEALLLKPHLVAINQGAIGGGLAWAKACKTRNIPYVIIAQLINDLITPPDEQQGRLVAAFENALKTFFVSQQNLCAFSRLTARKLANAQVVQNPYKQVQQIPAYPSTEHGYHLAFVASLHCFHKGQDLLFEVLAKEKWRERKIFIHLYGEGPNQQLLIRLKERLELHNVFFEGYNTVENIWAANHGLIMCSRFEGQSLALIEAFYCNRMAIVTNTGDAGLLVEEGKTGFLSAYAFPEFIDGALERAWKARNSWETLGINAGARLKEMIKTDPVLDFTDTIEALI